MADVSGRDRGQLFLVGALIIATLLVVLALFLNSGIYAQNLSARNADPGVSGAVEYRGDAVAVTEETMVRLNREDPANNSDGDLATAMEEWSNGTAVHGAYRGKARAVTVTERDGTLVRQGATGTFTNASDDDGWTVVEDTGRIRGFRMNVSRHDTNETSGLNVSQLSTQSFYANVENTDTGDEYDVYVGKNATGSAVNVTVDGPGAGPPPSCEAGFGADDRATVDVTNASVGGTHCAPLANLADLEGPGSEYTLRYENAEEVNGTYEMIVRDDGTIDSNDFYASPDDGSPWTADAVYAADLEVFYRARSVTYETDVEIVPEEELS
jgi:hypothetical protein